MSDKIERTDDNLHNILVNFLKDEKRRFEKNERNLSPMQLAAIDGVIEGWHDIKIIKKDDNREFKVVTGDEMMDIETKESAFIIERLVPERAITSITADSGKGKSILSIIMAKAIAGGDKLFGEFNVKQGKVLIVDLEMDADLIQGRHKAIIRERGLPIDYIYEQPMDINNEQNFLQLVELARSHDVIIFDTLTNLHSKNENSSDEMKEVNKAFLKLIYETGATVIYLHHHRKRQQGEYFSQSSSRGSTEIIAKVASHLLVDSKQWVENSVTYLELTIQQEKARRPERINKIGLKISYDPSLKETHYKYLGEIDDKGKKVEQAKEFVLKTLQSGEWLSVNKLKDKGVNIGGSNLREALKELARDKALNVETGSKLGKDQKRAKYYSLAAVI